MSSRDSLYVNYILLCHKVHWGGGGGGAGAGAGAGGRHTVLEFNIMCNLEKKHVANIASSKCKFPLIWKNPPLIQCHVYYYPSSKSVCIYVSFKLVEVPLYSML